MPLIIKALVTPMPILNPLHQTAPPRQFCLWSCLHCLAPPLWQHLFDGPHCEGNSVNETVPLKKKRVKRSLYLVLT